MPTKIPAPTTPQSKQHRSAPPTPTTPNEENHPGSRPLPATPFHRTPDTGHRTPDAGHRTPGHTARRARSAGPGGNPAPVAGRVQKGAVSTWTSVHHRAHPRCTSPVGAGSALEKRRSWSREWIARPYSGAGMGRCGHALPEPGREGNPGGRRWASGQASQSLQ